MQRGQSHCHASSRRHSSQAVRLKKAGAAPGKDGSPMLGQKSTKLPCFGHSSAGISFAFVIVVRAVSPFGRPNVGFGVHSVIAVMSLHDRSCTESGNQSAILLCRRSANCTRSSRGQSWMQTGERLRREAFSDRSQPARPKRTAWLEGCAALVNLSRRQHVAAGPEAGFERGRIVFG